MKQRRPLFCGRRQGLAQYEYLQLMRGGFLRIVSWFPDNTPGQWFAHNTPTSERSVFPEPTIRPPTLESNRPPPPPISVRAASLQSPSPCVRTDPSSSRSVPCRQERCDSADDDHQFEAGLMSCGVQCYHTSSPTRC